MTTILIAMLLGISLGFLDIFSYNTKRRLNQLSNAALFVMLFCLAAKVSCDKELSAALATLWHQSILLAVAVLAGSVLGVYLVALLFQKALAALFQEDTLHD